MKTKSKLSICISPDFCGATCVAPMEWYYVLAGNQLTLTSTMFPDMVYIYIR